MVQSRKKFLFEIFVSKNIRLILDCIRDYFDFRKMKNKK